MSKLAEKQNAARAAVEAWKSRIVELDGKQLGDAERDDLARLKQHAETVSADYLAAKQDHDLMAKADELAAKVGLPEGVGVNDPSPTLSRMAKNLGYEVVNSATYKALLDQHRDGRGEVRFREKTRVEAGPIPIDSKAFRAGLTRLGAAGGEKLFTGVSDTSAGAFVVADRTDIVEMLGRRTLTVRDLISVRRTGSDLVEYVVQTAHTNNAAPVAEATTAAGPSANTTTGVISPAAGAGVKPSGTWAFDIESTAVKTIAEWTPVTKRALADVSQLEDLINDELRADVAEAEETQVVSGNGSGENLTGILSTSGTQAQAWSTNIFDTIRKALTKVRTVGRATPTAIGLNPADVETIDLAKDGDSRYYGGGPFIGGPRTLWGYPIAESEAIPAGTGIVADWRKAVLWDREDVSVSFSDSHADFFIRNLVAILAEERVAFGVTRPSAFVIADLTA